MRQEWSDFIRKVGGSSIRTQSSEPGISFEPGKYPPEGWVSLGCGYYHRPPKIPTTPELKVDRKEW